MTMALHTELYLNCSLLIPDVRVVRLLDYLFNGDRNGTYLSRLAGKKIFANTDVVSIAASFGHPFFRLRDWTKIGCQASYYLSPVAVSAFVRDSDDVYFLITKFDFEDSGHAIVEFCRWLHLYIKADDGDFIGYYMMPDWDFPGMLYYRQNYLEFIKQFG